MIGSRRLSSELGDLIDRVNADGGHGFRFDYRYDADGHPDNYYCRSDHYMYARFGIPIAFFTKGGATLTTTSSPTSRRTSTTTRWRGWRA
jgi:hypothetical protein